MQLGSLLVLGQPQHGSTEQEHTNTRKHILLHEEGTSSSPRITRASTIPVSVLKWMFSATAGNEHFTEHSPWYTRDLTQAGTTWQSREGSVKLSRYLHLGPEEKGQYWLEIKLFGACVWGKVAAATSVNVLNSDNGLAALSLPQKPNLYFTNPSQHTTGSTNITTTTF